MLWFFGLDGSFVALGAGFVRPAALFISWICEEENQEKPAQILAGRLIWAVLILWKIRFSSWLMFWFFGFDGWFLALAMVLCCLQLFDGLNLWREKSEKPAQSVVWRLILTVLILEKICFLLQIDVLIFWFRWQFCCVGIGFCAACSFFMGWICEEKNQVKTAQSLSERWIWVVFIL